MHQMELTFRHDCFPAVDGQVGCHIVGESVKVFVNVHYGYAYEQPKVLCTFTHDELALTHRDGVAVGSFEYEKEFNDITESS